jgi:membrane-bound lytic murein transglycosylase B
VPPSASAISVFVAIALSGCGVAPPSAVSKATAGPSVEAHPLMSPSPAAVSDIAPVTVVDAHYVAARLGAIEQAIQLPNTPASKFAALAQQQQQTYHLLEAHPDWVPTVLDTVPPSVRPAIEANLSAAQQIGTLNGLSSHLPHWKIVAPPPADTLLAYYNQVEQVDGIAWQYLAAINLIETNMGRIQGLSSAGAQGPMQFMPATWASYGRGDVNDPHDAIMAAGRYLKAHGAPQNMTRAIYAYNPSMLYVRAVQLYAQQMFDNSRAYLAYYNWQVYVPTPSGIVLLPEGFSG